MDVLTLIDNIKSDLKNISSVKDSKIRNNIEQTIQLLEESWKREKNRFQEQIIELQQKVINKLEKNNEQKSYAMVLKERTVQIEEPKFAVLITAEGKETSEDIKSIITKTIKVPNLGIGINGIKKTTNNKIIMTCSNKEDAQKLKTEINKNKNGISAEELKKKRPCMIIKGVGGEYNEENFLNDLILQNGELSDITNESIKVTKILKNRKSDQLRNVIIETTGPIRKTLLEKQRVNIGFVRAHIEDCNPLTQCYHCLGFGHTSLKCLNKMNKPRCIHCAKNHKFSECEKTKDIVKCYNCDKNNNLFGTKNNTEHSANSEKCTYRKRMFIMAQQRIDYE